MARKLHTARLCANGGVPVRNQPRNSGNAALAERGLGDSGGLPTLFYGATKPHA